MKNCQIQSKCSQNAKNTANNSLPIQARKTAKKLYLSLVKSGDQIFTLILFNNTLKVKYVEYLMKSYSIGFMTFLLNTAALLVFDY